VLEEVPPARGSRRWGDEDWGWEPVAGWPSAVMTSVPHTHSNGGQPLYSLVFQAALQDIRQGMQYLALPKTPARPGARQHSQMQVEHKPTLPAAARDEIHGPEGQVERAASSRHGSIPRMVTLSRRGRAHMAPARMRSWRWTIPTTLLAGSRTGSAITPCLSMSPTAFAAS
jgi:hypothetical protein